MTTTIRKPARTEKSEWLSLWQGYLTFYEKDLSDKITDLTWQRLHDPLEQLHIMAAYKDNFMIGIAHYLLHRSTWAENYYCYLEDLYIAPEARGKGAARALIEAVKQEAIRNGCGVLHWMTGETNKTAHRLYDRMAEKSDMQQYQISLE